MSIDEPSVQNFQASLLAWFHPTLHTFPVSQWLVVDFVNLTVAGAAPDLHRTSLLGLSHLNMCIIMRKRKESKPWVLIYFTYAHCCANKKDYKNTLLALAPGDLNILPSVGESLRRPHKISLGDDAKKALHYTPSSKIYPLST